jgi:hypothetical protein
MVGISNPEGPGIIGQLLLLVPAGIGYGIPLEKDHIPLGEIIMNPASILLIYT